MPSPTRLARSRSAVLLTLLLGALAIGACGEDEGPAGNPADPGRWRAQVEMMCSDGSQEAVALPLPQTPRQLGPDAKARAEIVTTVRDGIQPLPAPEGSGGAVEAYLAELSADIELLRAIDAQAAAGGDASGLEAQLDESAGQAALELDLRDCAAFANAIARTP